MADTIDMEVDGFRDLEVVVVCGLPGAGKSTYARTHFRDSGHRRVNRNEIRRMLHTMTTFGDLWHADLFNERDDALVKHVERRIIEHLLHEGQKVLIDNTSVTAASRSNYLKLAEHAHKKAGVIFVNTPIHGCLERNQSHQDHIPDTVVVNLFAAIELPRPSEGFQEILVVE